MKRIFIPLVSLIVLFSLLIPPAAAQPVASTTALAPNAPVATECPLLNTMGVPLVTQAQQERGDPCAEIDAKVDAELERQGVLYEKLAELGSEKAERQGELTDGCPQDLSIMSCVANAVDKANAEYDDDIAEAQKKFDDQTAYLDRLIDQKSKCHSDYRDRLLDDVKTASSGDSDETNASAIAGAPNNEQPPAEPPSNTGDGGVGLPVLSLGEMVGGALLGVGTLAVGWHLIHNREPTLGNSGKEPVMSNNPNVSADDFQESMTEKPTLLAYDAGGQEYMKSNNNPYEFNNLSREEKARVRRLNEIYEKDYTSINDLSTEDRTKVLEYRKSGYGQGFPAVLDLVPATAKVGVKYIEGIAKGKAGLKVPWWDFIQTMKEWANEVRKTADKHNEGESKPKTKP